MFTEFRDIFKAHDLPQRKDVGLAERVVYVGLGAPVWACVVGFLLVSKGVDLIRQRFVGRQIRRSGD